MAITEAQETALHLFRHLLRASSYLPDEFARAYIHNHIGHQFRKARQPGQHTKGRLEAGRAALQTLKRAADGNIIDLTKVLHKAYGRSGRRRHELLCDLVSADAKSVLDDGAAVKNVTAKDFEELDKWISPPPLLTMLLQSQAANNPPENSRGSIRTLQPKIEKTIWGQEMIAKRRRNTVKRFWASMLDKVLPPLPEVEWKRLEDLTYGRIPFKGPPPPRATGQPIEKKETLLNAATFLKLPIGDAARPEKAKQFHQRDNHKITGRFMRRIWAKVWSLCPLMTYNGNADEWAIRWGGLQSAASQGLAGIAGQKDLELFEGMSKLDEVRLLTGKLGKQRRRNLARSRRAEHIKQSDS